MSFILKPIRTSVIVEENYILETRSNRRKTIIKEQVINQLIILKL